jgi:hypothetical protein
MTGVGVVVVIDRLFRSTETDEIRSDNTKASCHQRWDHGAIEKRPRFVQRSWQSSWQANSDRTSVVGDRRHKNVINQAPCP